MKTVCSADSDGVDIESDKEAVREFIFRAAFTKEEGIKRKKKREIVQD